MKIVKVILLAVGALGLMASLVHAQCGGHPCGGRGVQMPAQVYTGLHYWMDRFDKQSRMPHQGPSYESPNRLHLYNPPLAEPGTPYYPPGYRAPPAYHSAAPFTSDRGPGGSPGQYDPGGQREATGRKCSHTPGVPYKCNSRTGWCVCPE